MKTVKQVAAEEVRFMWGPMSFGLIVTAMGYVMALRGDTNTACWLTISSLVWHVMELAVLFSFRADIVQWAVTYRGRY